VQRAAAPDDVVQRIGHLVRMLRESMRELGLDKEVEKAAQAIPDARDRLSYIASMTEQAAERALNAIDRAQPIQDEIGSRAEALSQRWQAWSDSPAPDLSGALVADTRAYLDAVPGMAQSTNKELLDIMMAQDFQDLTGQVIKRMVEVVRGMEFELLQVLLDNVPDSSGRGELQRRTDEMKADALRGTTLLNGPQVRDNEPEVVSNQDQVDDLLAELGF
jgi:chemotaxis protein CheZ